MIQAQTPRRDFVGYGATPPDPKWPGGARLAVQIVMNYEEGSEYSIADGDGFTEAQLTEGASSVPKGERDLAAESIFEFGSRVGFWRLMNLFEERKLPITVFGCALALERNPQAAAAIRAAGHDVCCHGWRWEKHWTLSADEEREHIQRAVASLQRTMGSRPLGWYCRYGPSENTRRLLLDEGGFLYDSDAYNDELPYWTTTEGRHQLVIPYTADVNDSKFANPAGFSSGTDYFEYVKDTFDVLYKEGAHHPKMMSLGLHMRLIGRPGRSAALARVLDYIQSHEDVWICRREEIARHWIEHHPPIE